MSTKPPHERKAALFGKAISFIADTVGELARLATILLIGALIIAAPFVIVVVVGNWLF